MLLKKYVLVCLALWLAATVASASEPQRLRVLSYNIHHGEGIDRKLDLERIARVILSVEPDIVALQEVDFKTERTGKVDQPAELARLTKMNVAFGDNFRFQGGGYGNAVLSKLPIAKHENHLLPSIDGGEQRGVLQAKLTLPDQSPLLLLATHFDYRADDRERLASVKVINDMAEVAKDTPALLAGDLNATPDSKTLRTLADLWTVANDEPLPTVPVEKPAQQIDFIHFRPANRWKVLEVQVLGEAVASDHRAIFAVLEWLPPAQKPSP